MKVKLKSNGTEHEIPKKQWDETPADFKRNYIVLSNTDTLKEEQVATNSVTENTSASKGKKKKEEEEKTTGTEE